MKVYLDSNNIVHKEYKDGYIEAEHSFFDSVPVTALECYKYIPEHNFIQCIDAEKEQVIRQQYYADEEKYNKILYDIAIDIGAIVGSK